MLAPDIIRVISSEEYVYTAIYGATSIEALRIVVWIFLLYFLSSLFTFTLIARHEQRKMILINTFIALFNIIGNILIIPYYSFIGSAYVTLLSQGGLFILMWFYARKNINTHDIWRMSA